MAGLSTRGMFATECEIRAARWAQRKLGCSLHERRVLSNASKLFDLTRPVLGLGMAENRLLRLSALVHDIGRSVSEKNHPEEGAAMIMGTTALALSPMDRRALAFLTRYHRGAVPPPHSEDFLRPADARVPLRSVLAILRVADALDSRRIISPKLSFAMSGDELLIRCQVDGDYRAARRVYGRRKKFLMLETLLGTPINVEVVRDESLVEA